MKAGTKMDRLVSVTLLCAAVAMGCAVAGCATPREVKDSGGLTEQEALSLSLEEQYAFAADRYFAFNDRVSDVQADLSEGEWVLGTTTYQVIPNGGGSRSNRLRGATNDNSYYFLAFRDLETASDLNTGLEKLEKKWATNGLEVEPAELDNGQKLYRAVAEDGFWIEMAPRDGKVELTAYSPVYWGDNLGLVVGIGDRREAEDAIGEIWASEMREDGTSLHLPGDYRPFPKWDAIPEGSEDYSVVKEE